MTDYKKQGKKNRAAGKRFELKVREELEKKGWIVFRNSNDVELGKFRQAKSKYNPFTKSLMMTQSGFPDFICISLMADEQNNRAVLFVECKINGYLKPEERAKADWIKNNLKIPIVIVKKGVKRGETIHELYS